MRLPSPHSVVHFTSKSLPELVGASCQNIELGPRQRLDQHATAPGTYLKVKNGMLAIDALATRSQRQILEFLLPGDIVPLTPSYLPRNLSMRAITSTTLSRIDEAIEEVRGERLLAQLQAQYMRSSLHQLMIGHLEAEARVASFLISQAIRLGMMRPGCLLSLPMSRDDIADYLAINRDTLSRIMMRFEVLELIERVSRHAISIVEPERLSRLTPISSLLMCAMAQPIQDVDLASLR